MNFELIQNALPILLIGAGVTIEITAFSVAVGFIIGLFVGIARICRCLLYTSPSPRDRG